MIFQQILLQCFKDIIVVAGLKRLIILYVWVLERRVCDSRCDSRLLDSSLKLRRASCILFWRSIFRLQGPVFLFVFKFFFHMSTCSQWACAHMSKKSLLSSSHLSLRYVENKKNGPWRLTSGCGRGSGRWYRAGRLALLPPRSPWRWAACRTSRIVEGRASPGLMSTS